MEKTLPSHDDMAVPPVGVVADADQGVTLTGSKADDIVVTSPVVDHDDPPVETPQEKQ